MKYLIFELFCIFILNSCNESKTDNKPLITVANSQIEDKDSIRFDSIDNWLSKKNLIKPKNIFLQIFKRAQDSSLNYKCDNFLESLQDKSEFGKIIDEFKIISYKDYSIMVRGFNSWSSGGIGTIICVLDKKDNIKSFRYECLNIDDCPGGIRIDSIYLNDWKENGKSDLIMKKFTRAANESFFDIEIFDFTSNESQIIKCFEYNFFHEYRGNNYWIYRNKDIVTFERPDLIKIVSKNLNVPKKIKKEDYDDIEVYKEKLKRQKEENDTTDEISKFYQFDSISKIFKEIKQ